jgi:hypothetical protein
VGKLKGRRPHLGVSGGIMLKCILKKWDEKWDGAWAGLILRQIE